MTGFRTHVCQALGHFWVTETKGSTTQKSHAIFTHFRKATIECYYRRDIFVGHERTQEGTQQIFGCVSRNPFVGERTGLVKKIGERKQQDFEQSLMCGVREVVRIY